ncbi:MAG: DUF1002 domain-containing protein [Romboutsia sp.]|uniref:DUF1002 domain-containing protein n=1 Tax=Romboutsia sp. TaxID=1965302 RepID=UPI00216C2C75|nr:DUF1002 domain-containing protein [Romboutsia sp.]MCI9062699.1 DUF1002 domain-containing protein [Romboutsia sp.]MCI9258981.1 DUF1002 domain-containing protein [Romboutsia sp.]
MNKKLNNFKKRFLTLSLTAVLSLSSLGLVFADGTRVVTLGSNLTQAQKDTMLKYFGVNKDEVVILEVNNQEERKYLQGVASEAQLGKKTYSCAYVEPTKSGSGINVKTANITWATPAMVATTLSTAGLTDADVVIAANFPVSGTGALTGIMKAFEDATGKPLEEDKKELASEELITTGDLGDDIGQDKATGIVNDVKTEIIKNNTKDTVQIAETINNVVNNYNVTLTDEQMAKLEGLMEKISKQDYDYSEMKNALESVSDVVNENLSAIGENVNTGFFDGIKNFFTGIGDWFKGLFSGESDGSSILDNTNDSLLGENAQIDATDKSTINLPSSEQVEGFFAKIWHWFTGLFNNDSNNQNNTEQTEITPNEENNTTEETINSIDENSSTEETPQDSADTTASNEGDSLLDVQTQDQGSFETQEQQSN